MIGSRTVRGISAMFFIFISSFCSESFAAGCVVPTSVQTYLNNNKKWRLVEIKDLDKSDQVWWSKNHDSECPGLSIGNFDGSGNNSYALSIVLLNKDKVIERLVFLQSDGKGYIPHIIGRDDVFTGADWIPFVVFRSGPGKYEDVNTGKKTYLRHDAFIFAELEAHSAAYYFKDGKIHMILVSD